MRTEGQQEPDRQRPVAVLGAGGMMGFAMARNLARAGIEVRAWNRSADKARPLAADGAIVAASPAEAASGAGTVLTMMSDADAVLGAMAGEDGALPAVAGSGAVWLQMSTIGESGTQECARLAAQHGLTFLDAPVLGATQVAEQGKLVVLASGPTAARQRVQPVFDIVGSRTLWLGECGQGTALKLVANSWVLAVVEAGAEVIALAEGLGVQPEMFLDAIQGGALDLPYLRLKAELMARRDFEPSFRLRLAAKDAALIEQAAARHDLDLPLFALLRRRLDEGVGPHGDKDFSATYLISSPRGLPGSPPGKTGRPA
jgi:3-hydroxyisobutyrate dehydrogenase